MKKLTFLLSFMLFSIFAYPQITIQLTVKGFGDKVSIGYWKDFNYVSDTLQLSGDRASYTFNASTLIHFRVATIAPDSYSPFFIAFPGDTIAIEKDSNHIAIKGGAESYNNFLVKTANETKVAFAGKRPDYNKMTKYLLDQSEEFFSTFSHPYKQLIKDIYTLSVITNNKLYPVMVKYANDTSKMNSLFYYIKNEGMRAPDNNKASGQLDKANLNILNSDNELIAYLDKINFNDPNIGAANMPDVMMMNNFIRIRYMQAVGKDSTLKSIDEHTVENKIIKTLFKESHYRSMLLGYNLYSRIEGYTQYPMQLAAVSDFIDDFSKEKFSSDLLPAIEKIYARQLATIGSLAKGAAAPSFKLPNTKGRLVSLSDFKGKVVYLDMWASWCGPCLKEMPYMETLRNKFKNKAVEMIAISIDTDTGRWLTKIAALKLKGTQLIDNKGSENSKIAKDYKIQGVPHYILIDKNGKIASAFAPRPSSGRDIENEINQLL